MASRDWTTITPGATPQATDNLVGLRGSANTKLIMSDIKDFVSPSIQSLPLADTLSAGNATAINQDGTLKQASMQQIKDFSNGTLDQVLVTATRALEALDAGRILYNNSPTTTFKITLPAAGDTTLPASFIFYILQKDKGTLEVEAPGAVTINGLAGATVKTQGTKQLFLLVRNADAWEFLALNDSRPIVELSSPTGNIQAKNVGALNVPGITAGSYVLQLVPTTPGQQPIVSQGASFEVMQTYTSATHSVVVNAVGGVKLNGVIDSQINLVDTGDIVEIISLGNDEYFAGTSAEINNINPVYGEMFFHGNATPTAIVTQGVPVKIAGTYLPGELQGFTHTAGTLTCTEQETRVYEVKVSTTASLNLASASITVFIAKNGVVIAQSAQSPDIDGVSPSFKSISLNKLVSLSNADTLDVWTQNDSGTDDITHKDLNVIVGSPGLVGAVAPSTSNLFAQTEAEVTVSGTAAATTMKGAGVGNMSFEANELQAGDSFSFVLAGEIRTNGAAQTLNFRAASGIYYSLFNTGAFGVQNYPGLTSYVLKVTSTVQATGVTGRIHSVIDMPKIFTTASDAVVFGTHTVDTTIPLDFDVTAQWGAASANNSVSSKLMTFTRI